MALGHVLGDVQHKKQRRHGDSLTVVDQTLIEVHAAHNADYEINDDKNRRKSYNRAEKGPLDESPAEGVRIEHQTPTDDIQSGEDEEHGHLGLQLFPRSEPTLESVSIQLMRMHVTMYRQKPRNEHLQSQGQSVSDTKS